MNSGEIDQVLDEAEHAGRNWLAAARWRAMKNQQGYAKLKILVAGIDLMRSGDAKPHRLFSECRAIQAQNDRQKVSSESESSALAKFIEAARTLELNAPMISALQKERADILSAEFAAATLEIKNSQELLSEAARRLITRRMR